MVTIDSFLIVNEHLFVCFVICYLVVCMFFSLFWVVSLTSISRRSYL